MASARLFGSRAAHAPAAKVAPSRINAAPAAHAHLTASTRAHGRVAAAHGTAASVVHPAPLRGLTKAHVGE